jgi:hypothetical protein
MPQKRTPAQRDSFASQLAQIGRGGAKIMRKRRLGERLDLPTTKAAQRDLIATETLGKPVTQCPPSPTK